MSWLLAAGGAVVLLGSMLAYTRFHLRQAEARHPPAGELVEVDGVRTHVLRRGPEDADPVVLLHGLNGSLRDFTGPIVDRLAERYRVLAVDRPGHGHTERPSRELSQLDRQADWLDGVLEAEDVHDALVVGHSLGGALAAQLALRHPERVRGLLLVAPYLYANGAVPEPLEALARWPVLRHVVAHLALGPIGRLTARRTARSSFAPEPVPPGFVQLWADRALRPEQFLTVLDEAEHLDRHTGRLADRYEGIDVPTYLLAAEADGMLDTEAHARRFQDEVPTAWISSIEDAGHMLPWTRPTRVLEALEELAHLARERTGGNGQAIREEA